MKLFSYVFCFNKNIRKGFKWRKMGVASTTTTRKISKAIIENNLQQQIAVAAVDHINSKK